jgi:hypothetical protein
LFGVSNYAFYSLLLVELPPLFIRVRLLPYL